jgi:hypothetical protein
VAKSRGARISVGSSSREDRWIRNPIAFRVSGVRRSRGVTFDRKGHEVPRTRHGGNTWQKHEVGPGSKPVDTHHILEEVNTLLTLAYREFMK